MKPYSQSFTKATSGEEGGSHKLSFLDWLS